MANTVMHEERQSQTKRRVLQRSLLLRVFSPNSTANKLFRKKTLKMLAAENANVVNPETLSELSRTELQGLLKTHGLKGANKKVS
jgi:hypothetical protein